ncbi:MAG: family 20 glycosylhydrolase [Opitutales bacterium]|nr:family 20 glycosylhydrolase [Opitutales bacterium]
MRAQLPQLFPRPRELSLRGGFLPVPKAPHPTALFLNNLPQTIAEAEATLDAKQTTPCRIEYSEALGSESYYLDITTSGIHLKARDAAGVFYGAQTLRQIFEQNPTALPCCEVLDSPDLPIRGFMLDISRCKIPTQNEFRQLIRALARLRVNQFQLYIEHSFAFPGHDEVWRDASPLTPAEIEQLDRECLSLGIELVPNLNTFGHMERWLRHPKYRSMAECPEGWIHPLTQQFKPIPGTLKPDDESLKFIGDLLDKYLPHFRSRQVNIGGDEPWELGQGFSKGAVEKNGKHAVYLNHLKKICKLVEARGRTPQFWGDILLEDLNLASEAPILAMPVIWGYDAGHPFNQQAERLNSLGRSYLIAPGTSTWQSFTGRLENALTNQVEAVAAAIKYQAQGILITSWGDNGNHQPWPTQWLPLASGLAQAWCFAANQKGDFDKACAILGNLNNEDATLTASVLQHLGRLDSAIQKSIRNKSLTWELLTTSPENLSEVLKDISPSELNDSLDLLEKGRQLAEGISDECVRSEIILGIDCAVAGIRRAQNKPLNSQEKEQLVAEYKRVWLKRARVGGLEESLANLI